jgi:hypothetical protein
LAWTQIEQRNEDDKSAREGRRPKPFLREHRHLGPRCDGFNFNGVWIRLDQFANAIKDYEKQYRAKLERPNDTHIVDIAAQNEADRHTIDAMGTLKIRNSASEVEARVIFKKGPGADRALQGVKSMFPTAVNRGLADDREAQPRTHTTVQSFLTEKAKDKY